MNNRGVALILSYMVIVVLATFGAIFGYRSIADSNIVQRQTDSARAFWIAESGLAQSFYSLMNDDPLPQGNVSLGGGTYQVSFNDISSGKEIKSTATYGGIQRVAKGYLRIVPPPFQNTLSAGSNLTIAGAGVTLEARGRTRISGRYSKLSNQASATFENFQEGTATSDTVVQIPDKNNNGRPDEFRDFQLFAQEVAASYPADEVIYVQTDGTVYIGPGFSSDTRVYSGKKVVYVEGNRAGKGNVTISVDPTGQDNQDITIISTGTINYYNPYQSDTSTVSVICWKDYFESATGYVRRRGTIFAHRNANFEDILGEYFGTVNIMANQNINLSAPLRNQIFDFSDRGLYGDMPSGFEFLGGGGSLLSTQLVNWQEE